MRRLAVCVVLLLILVPATFSQSPANLLLPEDVIKALQSEISGMAARDTVSSMGRFHRVQASSTARAIRARACATGGFDAAQARSSGNGASGSRVSDFPPASKPRRSLSVA